MMINIYLICLYYIYLCTALNIMMTKTKNTKEEIKEEDGFSIKFTWGSFLTGSSMLAFGFAIGYWVAYNDMKTEKIELKIEYNQKIQDAKDEMTRSRKEEDKLEEIKSLLTNVKNESNGTK